MPRGDRNGPNGGGPKTGRGAGLCSGSDTPGYLDPGLRRGRGRGPGGPPKHGRGRGRGPGGGRWGRRWWRGDDEGGEAWTDEAERAALGSRCRTLKAEVQQLRDRLDSLEGAGGSEPG